MPGSTAGTRSRPVTAVIAALAAILTGCSPFVAQACPAIGWINRIDIRLDGSAEDVERVGGSEACGGPMATGPVTLIVGG